MPWTKSDYPDAFKNLNEYVRLKAIDIANAMVVDGYEEGRAIPIATKQAKEWYKDASNKEKSELKSKDITDHEKTENSSSDLADEDVIVEYSDNDKKWRVITKGAKRADSLHDTKESARKRAAEIIKYRDAEVIVKNKNGSIK